MREDAFPITCISVFLFLRLYHPVAAELVWVLIVHVPVLFAQFWVVLLEYLLTGQNGISSFLLQKLSSMGLNESTNINLCTHWKLVQHRYPHSEMMDQACSFLL